MSRVEENQEDAAYAAFHLVFAFIIYLFGVFVFLPLGRRVEIYGVELIVSAVFLLLVALYLVKGLPFLEKVLNFFAVKVSDWWIDRKGLDDSESPEVLISSHLWVSIAGLFIIFFLLSPLLYSINPALNGLTLILVIITSIFFYMLYKRKKKVS